MHQTRATTRQRLNLVLVQPEGYAHSGALAELAETLLYGLFCADVDIHFNYNTLDASCTNILLGAHLLDAQAMAAVPAGSVIYNSEQVDESSTWIGSAYLELLRRNRVWDYSQKNIERLRFRGIDHAEFVPIGYVPELTRIPAAQPQDIDVLFFGAINERRRVVLEKLVLSGLRVEFLSGVYREERDQYIARAKVVLNMHYYDASVFEIVRVSYLLANEKAVVAEVGEATSVEAEISEAVCGVPYDRLVDTCIALVGDANRRANLARRGFELFSRRSEAAILRRALHLTEPATPAPFPGVLNLGSGKDWRKDFLNVDISPVMGPDALLDIAQPLGEPHILQTSRFGEIELRENTFDTIIANDVLEHIPDLVQAMGNALKLLKPGGVFIIAVPYDLSLGAWQDPTHVRAFNENSWRYFTDWYWYLGWSQARFEQLSLEFVLSDYGQQLQTEGRTQEELLRTPRAVDSMRVMLRKRYLVESEIARLAEAGGNRNGAA